MTQECTKTKRSLFSSLPLGHSGHAVDVDHLRSQQSFLINVDGSIREYVSKYITIL